MAPALIPVEQQFLCQDMLIYFHAGLEVIEKIIEQMNSLLYCPFLNLCVEHHYLWIFHLDIHIM